MAECKYCKRSGWFLKISDIGLCNNCSPIVHLDVRQRIGIIEDSIKLINESKNLDTRLSRLDVLLEHTKALIKYEQLGISVTDTPSVFHKKYHDMRDKIILDSLKIEIDNSFAKTSVAVTIQTKINSLSKVLLKIREYKSKTNNTSTINELEKQVSNKIQNIQLEGYLDTAKKAEFKGQKKKALDQYFEALYLLKKDDIDDSLQQNQINHIESKIVGLGDSLS